LDHPTDNVILKIKGKNGKLIEKAAYILEEHEVLFKSGTTFVVESVQKIEYPIFSRAIKGEEVFEIIIKEK